MDDINALLARNAEWAAQVKEDEPGFFSGLADGQSPPYFWIGCSDSRVPATQVTGSAPGEVFVHRCVANIVQQSDPNCMSALQYAVLSLKVRHVVVCGHYGCGGVLAALQGGTDGAVATWLQPVEALAQASAPELAGLDEADAARKLCELNVLRSVNAVCSSEAITEAWQQGQAVSVHGLIYDLQSGLLSSLQEPVSAPAEDQ